MDRLDFIVLGLQPGEKVLLSLNVNGTELENHPDTVSGILETEAYFNGFRLYGSRMITDHFGFYPVFGAIKKNGDPSQRLLGGLQSWAYERILSVKQLAPSPQPRLFRIIKENHNR